MSTIKKTSNKQGAEIARIWRQDGVPSGVVQKHMFTTIKDVGQALRDGRSITIGPVPTELQYPDWVEERLTPNLEVTKVTHPGEVDLWLDPRQESDRNPTGHEVYEAHGDRLKKALSFGNLKWYEENPDKIPAEWKERGLLIYGWASVVRDAYGFGRGSRGVPYLRCGVDRPFVYWCSLGFRWFAREPSGLLAS